MFRRPLLRAISRPAAPATADAAAGLLTARASWDERDVAWCSQRVPGKKGIALFKLRSNDWRLVTVPEIEEALAAYAAVPERERAELEANKKWAAWIEWLHQSRQHGEFEVEWPVGAWSVQPFSAG